MIQITHKNISTSAGLNGMLEKIYNKIKINMAFLHILNERTILGKLYVKLTYLILISNVYNTP